MVQTKRQVEELFKTKAVIRLDVGCGSNKQSGWVGMDIRSCNGVDIIHDVQDFPWPIPNSSCFQILLSHLWEHIEPKYRIQLMNELWRIVTAGGQLMLSAPHADSVGASQDPTHYMCPNENTFLYFDTTNGLYQIYKPKPWKIVSYDCQPNGNIEVIMEPRK